MTGNGVHGENPAFVAVVPRAGLVLTYVAMSPWVICAAYRFTASASAFCRTRQSLSSDSTSA